MALIILPFLQHFKDKFENVYCCIFFLFLRVSICALEFINFFLSIYQRAREHGTE